MFKILAPLLFLALFFSCSSEFSENISDKINENEEAGIKDDSSLIKKNIKPNDPKKKGFIFKGWYKDPDFKKPFNVDKDSYNTATTLYAKWVAEKIVSFNIDGKKQINKVTVEEGKKVTKPNDPKKSGFFFKGWYGDSRFNKMFDFNTKITSDITIYAKWAAERTVNFNINEKEKINQIKIEEGKKVTKPNDPKRRGFLFKGWYSDSRFNKIFDFNTKITSDITLYAKWVAEKITITFDTGSASDIDSLSINWGDKITKPKDPFKAGHLFSGWYKESSFQNIFDFNENISVDTIIYAKFDKISISDPSSIKKIILQHQSKKKIVYILKEIFSPYSPLFKKKPKSFQQQVRPAPRPFQQFRSAPRPFQQFRPAPKSFQLFRPTPPKSFYGFKSSSYYFNRGKQK